MKLEDLIKSPENLLKHAPLKEGMIVVDYGCGPGRYTIPAAKRVGPRGKVYAVDIQPLAIEIVKKKAARDSLTNIQTVLANSFNTGIAGSSADMVLLIDAITPIKDRKALLEEIFRLLKPEGFLFMDSSHMTPSQAKSIVENMGLFVLVNLNGRNMCWIKKKNA